MLKEHLNFPMDLKFFLALYFCQLLSNFELDIGHSGRVELLQTRFSASELYRSKKESTMPKNNLNKTLLISALSLCAYGQ